MSIDDGDLDRASADGSRLSPVISEQLPLGRAELVALARRRPGDRRHRAPPPCATGCRSRLAARAPATTARRSRWAAASSSTRRRARTIDEVADGELTADAGATFVELERAADATGQQILMYPSTARSTIGGFLSGGSGGTGSIRHGVMHRGSGFVRALDVVHARPDAELVHVDGDDAQLYLHNYGTAGIIARATIALEPRQDWHGLFASFDRFEQALAVIRPFADLQPTPRLVSADPPAAGRVAAQRPRHPAGTGEPAGDPRSGVARRRPPRSSTDAGGRVEDVRDGLGTTLRISMMSYNHPIEWLQKAHPDTYFHVEVNGDALVDRFAELVEVYPGGDAPHRGPEGSADRHAHRAVPGRRRRSTTASPRSPPSASATTTATSGTSTTSPSAPAAWPPPPIPAACSTPASCPDPCGRQRHS